MKPYSASKTLLSVNYCSIDDIYNIIATTIDDMVTLYSSTGETLFVNPSAKRILGYSAVEMYSIPLWEIACPEDRDRLYPSTLSRRSNCSPYTILWKAKHKNGKWRWIETRVSILDQPAEISGFLCISRDVTDREQLLVHLNANSARLEQQKQELEVMNALLAHLATRDSLTGLKNHRAFQERLNLEYQRAKRYESSLSLIMIDVDWFKPFNDTFGHPAGDVVLQQVAGQLLEHARHIDSVCRYGGEEFAMILPNTDSEGSFALAERLRNAIASAAWSLRQITASFGVTTLSEDTPDLDALVNQADRALYYSKYHGKDRVFHFNSLPVC